MEYWQSTESIIDRFQGGVHYLTLSGLVKPVKWHFAGPCHFSLGFIKLYQFVWVHQKSSFCGKMV